MKRLFTTLCLTISIICATQQPYIDPERLHYVVEFHRAAKDILRQASISMDELQDMIKSREESGFNTEKNIIEHIILYYTMLEIEKENDEKIDDCYSLDECADQCSCS